MPSISSYRITQISLVHQCVVLSGPGLLDLSSQGLHKLDPAWFSSEEIHTLLLDQNHIIKLEHLERNEALLQVSSH